MICGKGGVVKNDSRVNLYQSSFPFEAVMMAEMHGQKLHSGDFVTFHYMRLH